MKNVLIFAAVAEAATGLALLIVPSLVGQLLLGEELTGVAIPVARVTGIALIALGIACWPGPPLVGMLTYSALVALYLAYLALAGGLTGISCGQRLLCTRSYQSSLDVFGWLATDPQGELGNGMRPRAYCLDAANDVSCWHKADQLHGRRDVRY